MVRSPAVGRPHSRTDSPVLPAARDATASGDANASQAVAPPRHTSYWYVGPSIFQAPESYDTLYTAVPDVAVVL